MKMLTMPCIVEWPITGWLDSFSWSGRCLQSLKKGVCRTRCGAPGHLARPNTPVYSVLSSSINFLLYVGWAKLSSVARNLYWIRYLQSIYQYFQNGHFSKLGESIKIDIAQAQQPTNGFELDLPSYDPLYISYTKNWTNWEIMTILSMNYFFFFYLFKILQLTRWFYPG